MTGTSGYTQQSDKPFPHENKICMTDRLDTITLNTLEKGATVLLSLKKGSLSKNWGRYPNRLLQHFLEYSMDCQTSTSHLGHIMQSRTSGS